jgi:hypothetical protein
MKPFSRAQIKMAETSPPSWPTSCTCGSTARARRMSLVTPEISAASRGRPNMNSSISVSQVRKRGHARVHDVQPFFPWPQSVGPSSVSRWKGLYTPSVSR